MRHTRMIAIAAALAALNAPTSAFAQEASSHLFNDSWFWGVHGGGTSIGTPTRNASSVGTIGGEWLITRSRGGLYAAFDQASFSSTSRVTSGAATSSTVDIRDLRTVSFAAVGFPGQLGAFRPYAGVGFGISLIGSANARPDSAGAVQPEVAAQEDNGRSRASVIGLIGAQWQTGRVAVFGQVVGMPSTSEFLITNAMMSYQAGIRYNFGSSIDK